MCAMLRELELEAMTRLLVCGSRDWDERGVIGAVLNGLHSYLYDFDVVIDGGARGADTKASMWAMANGINTQTYLADWDRYNAAAGPIRNQRMLDEGKPDLVAAFINKPLDESKGTKHMVGIARVAGVKTIVVEVR